MGRAEVAVARQKRGSARAALPDAAAAAAEEEVEEHMTVLPARMVCLRKACFGNTSCFIGLDLAPATASAAAACCYEAAVVLASMFHYKHQTHEVITLPPSPEALLLVRTSVLVCHDPPGAGSE